MKTLHKPILKKEILEIFSQKKGEKKTFLDATFGRGGHSQAILEKFPEIQVVAIDQDTDAVEYAKKEFKDQILEKKFTIIHSNFAKDNILETTTFDGILMDLGVSSPQLDTASRGFSFYHEGPLDMRMDPRILLTASEIINTWEESDIADVFFHLGDVKKSRVVARRIVEKRKEKKFETTKELADFIAKILGWKSKGHHPATECFLALRIQVNDELRTTQKGIQSLVKHLNPYGLFFVITFHSIEDRLVKKIFLDLEIGKPLFKKVIVPSKEEQNENPRSRSAKLRVFERSLS